MDMGAYGKYCTDTHLQYCWYQINVLSGGVWSTSCETNLVKVVYQDVVGRALADNRLIDSDVTNNNKTHGIGEKSKHFSTEGKV